MRLLAVLFFSACATFASEPSMQGRIEAGLYRHPLGNFSCPVPDEAMGFDADDVRVVDAWRDEHWEKDLFTKKERLVLDGVRPSSGATFRNGPRAGASAMVEINLGGMIHKRDMVLESQFGGGFAKPFETRFFTTRHGDAGYQLMLVPWYDPELSYMGANLLAAYMADDKKAPPDLVAMLNVIHGNTHYHVAWTINAGPMLPPSVGRRDLPKIYAYFEQQPERLSRMRRTVTQWFEACDVTDFSAETDRP